MKLWEKGHSIDKKIEQFTIGNDRELDHYLAKYDLQASKAHAHMLQESGLLTKKESHALIKVLEKLQKQVKSGDFHIEKSFEDVHSKIEYELVQSLGATGKKIHTGRSRNDQVLVAMLLFFKDHLGHLQEQLITLIELLLQLSEKHEKAFLPGYTHLQVAMPSSFGLWFAAYAELLIDDLYMIQAALKVVDQNPLGSAAGYGSSFPIDRMSTTKYLGFSALKVNVVAAQLSREKTARNIHMALSSVAHTIGKFAMDVCLYMNPHFGFIGLPDSLTTGSSIMPHKKNPDLFEVMRGECNKIQAAMYETNLISTNLPSGYHRDYQLLKEKSILNLLSMENVIDILTYTLPQIEVKSIDQTDTVYQYVTSVDAINSLVIQGKSFRDAYQLIANEIKDGTYDSKETKAHTHIGSKDNLGIAMIRKKLREAL